MTSPASAAPRRPWFDAFAGARDEVGVILVVMAAAAGLLGFLGLADSVTDGHTRMFDEGLMLMLRQPGDISHPIGPEWLKLAAMDITAFGSIIDLAIIVLVISGLFIAQRRIREGVLLIAAAASGLIMVDIVKLVVGRERPPLAMHAVEVGNASFPSGHAMLSAIVYLSLATLIAHFADRRGARVFALTAGILLTLIVGCSRVYLGVHWPTDVIAGWTLGAAWAMLWWLIAWILEHRADEHSAHPAA